MEDELQVDIDGTTYSLVKLPERDTRLVLSERERLLIGIDLKTLVEDLSCVGKCIRVAYNGVTAAGPTFTNLQIEVQGLCDDITKLCDKSAIKLKRPCETILTTLQSTCAYLLDNFEDMALRNLEFLSKLVGEMASEAEELHKDFEEETEKVVKVWQKTKQSKVEQAIRVKELKKEGEELKIRHEHQQQIFEQARKAEEEAQIRLRDYELKEDEANQQLGEDGNIFTKLVNGLTSVVGVTAFGDSQETKERRLRQWRAEKVEALEKRVECKRIRVDAYEQLIKFAVKNERCRDEKELAAAASDALHEATGGLRKLAKVMKQASVFWKRLQVHCKSLGEDKLKEDVEYAMKNYDDARRRKFWTTPVFKQRAVNFYAGWVALDCICAEYMSAIQETRKDLYKYITENPSYEEAGRNVQQLAAELQRDLREQQKAIQDQISEAGEETDKCRNSQDEQ